MAFLVLVTATIAMFTTKLSGELWFATVQLTLGSYLFANVKQKGILKEDKKEEKDA